MVDQQLEVKAAARLLNEDDLKSNLGKGMSYEVVKVGRKNCS